MTDQPQPSRLDLEMLEEYAVAMWRLVSLRKIRAGIEPGEYWRGEMVEAEEAVAAFRVHYSPWIANHP